MRHPETLSNPETSWNGSYLTNHRLEMWKLDHWRPLDDKIGTIFFPTLNTSGTGTNCNIYGCDKGRVRSFRAKKSGTSVVSATAAVRGTGAVLADDNGWCCDPLEDPLCD